MSRYKRTVAIGLIAVAAAILARFALIRKAHDWLREASGEKPPRYEAPEDDFRRRGFSLQGDILQWTPDFGHYPYRATDFFLDPKVAKLAEVAREGNFVQIDRLVARGVNVNARGYAHRMYGLTPLMYAMSGRTLTGFLWLLERGADPNLQTDDGQSAVTFAVEREDSQALKIILAHGGNPNLDRHSPTWFQYAPPIYYAIMERRPENARILIKAGADLNARSWLGATPLTVAASTHSVDVLYVLLEAGADFRAQDDSGHSGAFRIIQSLADEYPDVVKARQKIVELLERRGLDFAEEVRKFAEWKRQWREERGEPFDKEEENRWPFTKARKAGVGRSE